MKKKVDITAIIVSPILAAVLTVTLNTSLFVSVLLFFGLPALYIIIRNQDIFLKSFIVALIFSVPLSLFFDALAAVDGSWVVPESLFPFRFLGVATVEVYTFSFFWVLFAILLYEHFFDRGRVHDPLSPHLKYLVYISSALVLMVVWYYFLYGQVPRVPYFYALVGVVSVLIPLLLFLHRYKKFADRFIFVGIYFFYTLLLFEFVALETGQWIFPGEHFIGLLPFFGHRLPMEEVLIWMVAATPALLAYYEFYADDLKLHG